MSALDGLPPDFDRHRDALIIAEAGACNPSGIAITLHHACRQVLAEDGRQADDPAVRPIAHQIACLLDVGGVIDPAEYVRLIDACRARTADRRPSAAA